MSKKKLYCVILLVCLLCCACGKKEGYNALSYQVTENDTLFICKRLSKYIFYSSFSLLTFATKK